MCKLVNFVFRGFRINTETCTRITINSLIIFFGDNILKPKISVWSCCKSLIRVTLILVFLVFTDHFFYLQFLQSAHGQKMLLFLLALPFCWKKASRLCIYKHFFILIMFDICWNICDRRLFKTKPKKVDWLKYKKCSQISNKFIDIPFLLI